MKSRFILVKQKSFTNSADQLNANKVIKISVDAKTSVKTISLLSFILFIFHAICQLRHPSFCCSVFTVDLFRKTFTFVWHFMTLLLQNIFIYLILKFLPLVIKFCFPNFNVLSEQIFPTSEVYWGLISWNALLVSLFYLGLKIARNQISFPFSTLTRMEYYFLSLV